jgi:transcriptional regulator with XRE-family HTH domain
MIRDMSQITTGEAVRARRKDRGLTIEQVAFKSGVSVATVQRVETDKSAPSIATITAIAAVLDVPITDLIETETTQAAS